MLWLYTIRVLCDTDTGHIQEALDKSQHGFLDFSRFLILDCVW